MSQRCVLLQCEHHLLPFYGVAHIVCVLGHAGVALAPHKVQALVAKFSKRLQVQVCCRSCFQATRASNTCVQQPRNCFDS